MKNVIKYDLIEAHNQGVTNHPQKDIENMGMRCIRFRGEPIADCVFMQVDHIPNNLPIYVEKSDDYEF